MIGIYKIVNCVNGKFYVGSSVNFNNRKRLHLFYLRNGNHQNVHLQRSWNKYGEVSFTFELVVELDDTKKLLLEEQKWLDKYYSTDVLYNICPIAGSSLGRKCSEETKQKIAKKAFGRIVSAETRKKLSQSSRGRTKSLEEREQIRQRRLGSTHSEKSKQLISLKKRGQGASKLTERKVKELRRLYDSGVRIKELHSRYNCSRTLISDVVHNKKWAWVN